MRTFLCSLLFAAGTLSPSLSDVDGPDLIIENVSYSAAARGHGYTGSHGYTAPHGRWGWYGRQYWNLDGGAYSRGYGWGSNYYHHPYHNYSFPSPHYYNHTAPHSYFYHTH